MKPLLADDVDLDATVHVLSTLDAAVICEFP